MFDNYTALSNQQRVLFLEQAIDTNTLEPEFYSRALAWEEYPLALWFLIKRAGEARIANCLSALIAICEKPNVEFESAGGLTSLHLIAAWSLGRVGKSCITPLLGSLKNSNTSTKIAIVDALGEIRDDREEVLQALISSLENDPQEVALWSALSLAKLGKQSLDYLHQALFSLDKHRAIYVLDAIIKIGSKESEAVIRNFVEQSGEQMRLFVAESYPMVNTHNNSI